MYPDEFCHPKFKDQLIEWIDKAKWAQHWLLTMSHPDKKISFFNDSAFGVAPENSEIFQYAQRLNIESPKIDRTTTDLINSGYVRMDLNSAVLLIDFADVAFGCMMN